jgi:hypothetical protein
MKKLVAILIVVIVCIPSVAPAPTFNLGPNAECITSCWESEAMFLVAQWVRDNCFNLNSSASLSNSFAVDSREAAGNPFNLGPNAECVYFNWFERAPSLWPRFWANCRAVCLSQK